MSQLIEPKPGRSGMIEDSAPGAFGGAGGGDQASALRRLFQACAVRPPVAGAGLAGRARLVRVAWLVDRRGERARALLGEALRDAVARGDEIVWDSPVDGACDALVVAFDSCGRAGEAFGVVRRAASARYLGGSECGDRAWVALVPVAQDGGERRALESAARGVGAAAARFARTNPVVLPAMMMGRWGAVSSRVEGVRGFIAASRDSACAMASSAAY
ncbi:MAG: hypothetical protein ACTS3F_07100 [Phycisphaerales bacterium]